MRQARKVVHQHHGARSPSLGRRAACILCLEAKWASSPFDRCPASQAPNGLRIVTDPHKPSVGTGERHSHLHRLGVRIQNRRPGFGIQ